MKDFNLYLYSEWKRSFIPPDWGGGYSGKLMGRICTLCDVLESALLGLE